jgi:hypothetical protein
MPGASVASTAKAEMPPWFNAPVCPAPQSASSAPRAVWRIVITNPHITTALVGQTMVKRVVLEHSNGMRQICGLLDIAEDSDLERQLLLNRMAFNLVSANKRHVVYREVSPEALAEGPKEVTPNA